MGVRQRAFDRGDAAKGAAGGNEQARQQAPRAVDPGRHRRRLGTVGAAPELRAVPYLDDSSTPRADGRFAAARISQGHLPLTSWFPYLGLGSPQFLHYQSLPSMISGVFGTVVNPDTVFRWSLVPAAGAVAARRLLVGAAVRAEPLDRRRGRGGRRRFLASAAGIGYENMAYVWLGYGVWTQLWASWTLPLAWGFTYRALSRDSLRRRPARRLLHHGDGRPPLRDGVPGLRRRSSSGRSSSPPTCGAGSGGRCWSGRPRSWRRPGSSCRCSHQSHWAARTRSSRGRGSRTATAPGRSSTGSSPAASSTPATGSPIITIFVGVGIVVCLFRWRTVHRRPRAGHHLRRHAPDDVRPDDVRGASTTSCPAAATSSSGASRWACSSRGSSWPASASSSWAGSS